jgi:hypothetical protein
MAPVCDHCGGAFSAEEPRVWRCVETFYVPRSVDAADPEAIAALPGRTASGGRTVISRSDRRVYYDSAFHLCGSCFGAASEAEGSAARRHRTTLMVMLAVILAVGAILFVPGVLPALADLASGRSNLFYDFSHHPITTPTTPYKEPFPTLPNAPQR